MPAILSKRLAKIVTPGLDPGVHLFREGSWMAGPSPRRKGFGPAGGTSPAMTLCM